MTARVTAAEAAKLLAPKLPLTFVVKGPIRTKKNHKKRVWAKGKPYMVPSDAYVEWNLLAVIQLKRDYGRRSPITDSVNCRALFLRDADWGDAVGFYESLADTLQDAGVIKNDRLIRAWDGSRIDVDRSDPRVIVTLEAIQ